MFEELFPSPDQHVVKTVAQRVADLEEVVAKLAEEVYPEKKIADLRTTPVPFARGGAVAAPPRRSAQINSPMTNSWKSPDQRKIEELRGEVAGLREELEKVRGYHRASQESREKFRDLWLEELGKKDELQDQIIEIRRIIGGVDD